MECAGAFRFDLDTDVIRLIAEVAAAGFAGELGAVGAKMIDALIVSAGDCFRSAIASVFVLGYWKSSMKGATVQALGISSLISSTSHSTDLLLKPIRVGCCVALLDKIRAALRIVNRNL